MSDKSKTNKSVSATPLWKNKTLLLIFAVVGIAGIAYGVRKFSSDSMYSGVPKRAIDLYKQGVVEIDKNDPENALEFLFKAVELDQTFADAQARIAQAYFMAAMIHESKEKKEMKNAMLEQSLTFVNKALAIDVNNGFAHLVSGLLAYEKNKFDEAILELEKGESSGIRSFELHTMLGYLYNEKEETAKCIEQYQKALELKPSDATTLHNLAELFFGVENFKKSTLYYGELLKLDSKDNTVKANYAASLWKEGDQTRAKELFNQILNAQGTSKFRVYNIVAWILIDKDVDIEWGIQLAQSADEMKKNNIESADILGWGYYKNKDYANAVKHLNISMNLAPSDEVKRRLLLAKEKLDESIKK